MDKQEQFIQGLLQALHDEIRSARNYHALAGKETDPDRKKILQRLAEVEERHAELWRKRLRDLGVEPGEFKETAMERMRRWVLTRSDIGAAAKLLEAGEAEADKLYGDLLSNIQSDADREAILTAQREERSHSRVLEEFTGGGKSSAHQAQGRLEGILRKEKWHVRGGGWIGQAIYGVNDGLGAAFGVVSGVAGATAANNEFVLLSGLATMLASALSMGSGAYLATKSEREVYEAELERERKEIEHNPAEEREELELFYQLKGFTEEESKAMVERLSAQPEQMLKTLAHEELGLSESTFPNEWRSAVSATISTAIGALVPVIPFMFSSGFRALALSFIVSTVAHFAVGASKVLVTGRSWIRSGTEMTLIGVGEAATTYGIGLLIAPALQ